jgi:hypothetical protein
MVIKVPERDAKGAARAITEGREYSTNRETRWRGTLFESICWAIKRIWFTKKIIKKKRKHTRKVKRASLMIYIKTVRERDRPNGLAMLSPRGKFP